MTAWDALANIRREYGNLSLSEKEANDCPIAQFKHWFAEVLTSEKSDPTAMVLATVDEAGHPDTRVVLLKAILDGSFVFYTNYQSVKALQLSATPYAALNFYWPEMARQVRVRGRVKKTSASMSDEYFASRPLESQLSAIASPQSAEIAHRLELEENLNRLIAEHQQALVVRPNHWGGFMLLPEEFEFWQGRENRLHDRIHYYQDQDQWRHRRLAP